MRIKWLPVLTLLAASVLVSCRDGDGGGAVAAHAVYSGQSAHWNQQAVPVSLQCGACHVKEFEEWAGSDHAWALRELSAESDFEPFHRQKLKAHGSEITFTANREGKLLLSDSQSGRTFEAQYVLGRRPLVQYLVSGEDGGYHTPSAAWDVTRHEWFDMFEGDARLSSEGLAARQAGDWGHWLGRGMNWNSQCAWCHTSHFRKNYDATANRYASAWKEPGVSCIQCHKLADAPSADGCMVAPSQRTLTQQQMHDNCATCHARREELDENFVVGNRFDNHFRLELPVINGVFWANGMQRDEDYCETGLRLSRMGAAGVTCLDCHNPHTAELKLPQEDNSLCMRCHAAGTMVHSTPTPIINPAEHSPCPAGSAGARCVECHMPESPYMARDPRRDHSFNSPDPELSAELGLPNTCLRCHSDKDHAWAAEVVRKLYPKQKNVEYRPRTRAVHHALNGRFNVDELLQVLANEPVPAWRATILELLAQQPRTPAVMQAARVASRDADALVRAAAARVLGREALSMVQDPVKIVRRAAAWPNLHYLVHMPQAQSVVQEMEGIARHQSDQPTGAMLLAELATARGRFDEAELYYKRAIALDPSGIVGYMDYAVFLAQLGRIEDALVQMQACAAVAPDNAEVHYRLGLVLAELRRFEESLSAFERALQLDPTHARAQKNKLQLEQFLQTHSQK